MSTALVLLSAGRFTTFPERKTYHTDIHQCRVWRYSIIKRKHCYGI